MAQKAHQRQVNYWVMKGNPDENKWVETLQPDKIEEWHTKKHPPELMPNDRVFCWESRRHLCIVGLAEIVNPRVRVDKDRTTWIRIRFLTRMLTSRPTIDELRHVPGLKRATFLEKHRMELLYRLSIEEAALLLSIVYAQNPDLPDVWRDLDLKDVDVSYEDPELSVWGQEGRLKLMVHFLRERNRALVEKKKRHVLRLQHRLTCEVCKFDFEVYGEIGRGFCEVHHRTPLSEVAGETSTKLKDLAIVCSNCHRMLHRKPPTTIEQLQLILAEVHRRDKPVEYRP